MHLDFAFDLDLDVEVDLAGRKFRKKQNGRAKLTIKKHKKRQ
jgi:hypothetical protein